MRSRLFKGGVCFNKTSEKVSVDKLKQFIRVKETLSDKSNIAKMKDSFVADLFSILTSTSCILDECYEESAYTLPFSLIYAAMTSKYLSIDARIQILTKCFDFFANYFKNYPSIDEEGGLRQKSGPRNKKLTLLSLNKIRRILNTIIAYVYALKKYPSNLGLNGIGSHSIECFFGIWRALLNNDNHLSLFLNKNAKVQIQKQLIDELQLPYRIKRFRVSAGE